MQANDRPGCQVLRNTAWMAVKVMLQTKILLLQLKLVIEIEFEQLDEINDVLETLQAAWEFPNVLEVVCPRFWLPKLATWNAFMPLSTVYWTDPTLRILLNRSKRRRVVRRITGSIILLTCDS